MKKEMLDMKVSTFEGNILIEQSGRGMENDSVVAIFPEQVDILIAWLQEAKGEAEAEAKIMSEAEARAEEAARAEKEADAEPEGEFVEQPESEADAED